MTGLHVKRNDNTSITMSPLQSKLARVSLGWSLTDASRKAGVGRATAARFELGEGVRGSSVTALRKAYEVAGVTFVGDGEISKDGGEGVRFRSQ